MPSNARVLIVDDHTLFAELLSTHLSQLNITVTGRAINSAQTFAMVKEQKPDLVILDISLGAESGVDLARELVARHPELPMLVLSTYSDPAIVKTLLDIGVSGFITKTSDFSELKTAIDICAVGGNYVSNMLRTQSYRVRSGQKQAGFLALTGREKEVVLGLMDGQSPKQVAQSLGISVKTVYVFRQKAMEKLGATSIAELLQLGHKAGLDQMTGM